LATLATRHALGATGIARPMGAFSMGMRVNCGLSYTTGQATVAQSAIVVCNNNNNNNCCQVTMLVSSGL